MPTTFSLEDITSVLSQCTELVTWLMWIASVCPPTVLIGLLLLGALSGGIMVIIIIISLLYFCLRPLCPRPPTPPIAPSRSVSADLARLEALRLSEPVRANLRGALSLCTSTARANVLRPLDYSQPSCVDDPVSSSDEHKPRKRR